MSAMGGACCLCCVARAARVGPGHLRGLLSLLGEAGLAARVRGDAAGLAEALGFGLGAVLRMLDALYEAGAIDGENRVVGRVVGAARRHGDAVTLGDAAVTLGDVRVTRGVTPGDDAATRRRRLLGRERTRRWRRKRKGSAAITAIAAAPAGPARAARGAATGDASPASPGPSLSLFPESIEPEKENKTRARGAAGDAGDAGEGGFAELAGLWPLPNRMADAEREYRRALRQIDAARLLALARHYLATKEPWRSAMFLANWLRTEPWRDPLLPLAARPVEVVAAEPKAPRIEWRVHADSWLARGIWPPDIGPPPDAPGCRMPEGLHQTTLARARRQHERERAFG